MILGGENVGPLVPKLVPDPVPELLVRLIPSIVRTRVFELVLYCV
jgi:hypothetical protein